VTNVQPEYLNVREKPKGESDDPPVVGKLSEGDTVCLTGASALAGGYKWWPVIAADGTEGWAAAFDSQDPARPWLTPTDRPCRGEPAPTPMPTPVATPSLTPSPTMMAQPTAETTPTALVPTPAPTPTKPSQVGSVPTFRGNMARTGANPGPGVERSPAVLWQFTASNSCGSILSSPVVAGGAVYVGTGLQGAFQLGGCVYAVDATTGVERWSFATDGGVVEATAAVVDGVVYTADGEGVVYALDAATGAEQWRFYMDAYTSSSPAVSGGALYIQGPSRQYFALDALNGRERWNFVTIGRVEGGGGLDRSAAVVGDAVYLGSDDGNLYSIDALTGAERWRFSTGGEGEPIPSTPAVADGVVYVASYEGRLYAVDAVTGRQRWSSLLEQYAAVSLAVANGLVYATVDHDVYALDAITGEQRWHVEPDGALSYWSPPTVAGDTVYVGSTDGHLYAFDATTGKERWRLETGGEIESTPAVVGGVVYITFGSLLWAIAEQ